MDKEQSEKIYFREVQRFPLWIRAIALLPCIVLIFLVVSMWLEGPRLLPGMLVVGAFAMFFLFLAVPNFVLKLVSTLDSSGLHLRIYPLSLPVPFLPPRVKDVLPGDVSNWEVRVYRPLVDREYWGTHFWSLGKAFGSDRYLYMMKVGPISGRGVQLQLSSGERLLVGSERPEELARAIGLAKGGIG